MQAPSTQPFSALNVWVVEDEPISCEMVCMHLEHLGVTSIRTASNGRQALKMLKQAQPKPDLILLDIYMPEMDGIEFLEALRPLQYPGALALMSGVNIEMLDLTLRMAADFGLRIVGAAEKPMPLEALEGFLRQAALPG